MMARLLWLLGLLVLETEGGELNFSYWSSGDECWVNTFHLGVDLTLGLGVSLSGGQNGALLRSWNNGTTTGPTQAARSTRSILAEAINGSSGRTRSVAAVAASWAIHGMGITEFRVNVGLVRIVAGTVMRVMRVRAGGGSIRGRAGVRRVSRACARGDRSEFGD